MCIRRILPVQHSVCLLIQQSLLFWFCCFLSMSVMAIEEPPQNNCWVYAATTPGAVIPGSESVNPAHTGQVAVNYWNPADTFLGLVVSESNIVVGIRVLFNNGDLGTLPNMTRTPDQACPAQEKCRSCEGEGNPIDPSTGNKFQVATDYQDRLGELALVRRYNSADMYGERGFFGRGWLSVLDQRLLYDFTNNIAYLRRSDGRQLRFQLYAGTEPYQLFFPNTRIFDQQGNELGVPVELFQWLPDADITATLTSRYDQDGHFIGWRYQTPGGDQEFYNVGGTLERIVQANGHELTITQTVNGNGDWVFYLHSDTGRVLEAVAPRLNGFRLISQLTDPAGNVFLYEYDQDRLIQVNYPDATSDPNDNPHTRYHYEDSNHPSALTGITDETGQRFASWAYDIQGRAIVSEHAGGVDRVTLSYQANGDVQITDAAGAVRTREYTEVQSRPRLSRIIGGRCPGCGEHAFQAYNADGFVVQTQDWNGTETVYTRDNRGLETSRTEAFNTPEARTIETDWHPVYRLPIQITEPRKITEYTYDDIHGTANLLEKREIDISGACAPGSNPPPTPEQCERITVYHYYPPGHVAEHRLHQIDGPRTDVNDITTFEYDNEGNQISITNALGHITEITEHDAHGNPLTIIDPNGMITELEYDARQRLIQRIHAAGTTEAATTQFEYYPNGLVERITDPMGVFLHYHYDAAQRLMAIEDVLGNTITYTLDNAGNRTQIDTRGPQGILTQTQTAVYNSLSQLAEQLGAENQTTAFHYDANGNPTDITDPKQQTTIQTYDPLNRLVEQLDPANGITRYDYNDADQLIRVEDPNTLETTYQYNGFDELIYQNSPDTQETHYRYDSAGNLIEKTDARGVTVHYRYDASNRLIEIDYPDNPGGIDEDVHYIYDQTDPDPAGQINYGISRLTRIQDAGGQTHYHYDRRGNRITADKIIHTDPGGTAAISLTVHYAYDHADRLTQTTYPSGRTINYQHDAAGQINQVSTTHNSQTQILADSITYRPFGPLQQATLGNGLTLNYHYDMDARLQQQTTTGIHEQTYAYDLNSNIEQIIWPQNPAANQVLSYDELDRLIQADQGGGNNVLNYAYDFTGNRQSKTENGQTDTYSYIPNTHRLESISGAQPQNYSYDLAGNPTSRNSDTLIYNQAGRLARIETANHTIEYRYNAEGQRTLKHITETSVQPNTETVTVYIYDLQGLLIAELDEQGNTLTEYAYLNGQPLVQIQSPSIDAGSVLTLQGQSFSGETVSATIDLNTQSLTAIQHSQTIQHSFTALDVSQWDIFYWAGREYRTHRWQQANTDGGITAYSANLILQNGQLIEGQLGYSDTAAEQHYTTVSHEPNTDAVQAIDYVTQTPANWQLDQHTQGLTITVNNQSSQYTPGYWHTQGDSVWFADPDSSRWTVRGYYHPGSNSSYLDTRARAPETALYTLSPNNGVYYYHNDHLGTPQKLTDQNQTIVWEATYTPFGQATVNEDPNNDGNLVTQNIRFPGQYFDQETGLHYNWFRYYDPLIGRYITSDPIGLLGGLNTYAYVGNNPVNLIDPFGLLAINPVTVKIIEGAVNTIGGLTVLNAGLNTHAVDKNSPMDGNVIPFPNTNRTPPGQCGPEDENPEDPCERARKQLQNNRDIFMQYVATIKDAGFRAKQMRSFAKHFNPIVNSHNSACPKHRVLPISIGPSATF